jgi:hypothetical protein
MAIAGVRTPFTVAGAAAVVVLFIAQLYSAGMA